MEMDFGEGIPNIEVLARTIWLAAKVGNQKAQEIIVERLEGKAVRGEKPATPDTTLNEQLERTEADLINSLAPKKED